MRKLPVFATLGNAIGFVFGNLLTIFRVSWLPFALFFGVAMLAAFLILGDMIDIDNDPKRFFGLWDKFLFGWVLLIVLQAIVTATVAVAIHRVILFNDRRPGDYFAFAFSKTEVLFVVMATIWILIVVAVVTLFLAPAAAFILQQNTDIPKLFQNLGAWPQEMMKLGELPPATFAPLLASYFVAWLVLIWLLLRLFVWPPTIVATNRLSLGEAWHTTKGNAWRILGLVIVTVICLWIVMAVVLAVLFAVLGLPPMPPEGADPKAIDDAVRLKLEQRFEGLGPLSFAGELLLNIYATAFAVALVSFTYKAIKGYDAKAPIPGA